MLDMHKLKLQYRELGSSYIDDLTTPLFVNQKRSFTHVIPTVPSE